MRRTGPLAPLLILAALLTRPSAAQIPTTRGKDSLPAYQLPPLSVSVTRTPAPLQTVPWAVGVVDSAAIRRGQATLGLDEFLDRIPGVQAANRYNYSLDQRLSIRGFGARANFGTRGVKILLDGIPQTLPDGQSQLTNVDYGDLARAEVIRGPASALYGNASGGVIALYSLPPAPVPRAARLRAEAGAYGSSRLQARGSLRQGSLAAELSLTRFATDGFRRHSRTEAVQAAGSLQLLLPGRTTATLRFAHANQPVADNPGALTQAELLTDRRAAAPNNVTQNAGKDVNQQQLSLSLHHYGDRGDEARLVLFGFRRELANPLATGTYITIDRLAGGLRASVSRGPGSGGKAPRVTAGLDLQRMRDHRRNLLASGGVPGDSVTVDQRETVTELGPFLQASWRPTASLTLAAGVRWDMVGFSVTDYHLTDGVNNSGDRSLSALSGNFGLSYAVSPLFTPYLNLATAFETPTTTELANRPDGAGGFNDSLGPQRAVTAEMGARGRAGHWLQWSFAGYAGRIRDAIVQYREVGGRAYFRNAGRLHNNGFEAGLSLLPLPGIALHAAYTYTHYRFANYRVVNGATVDTLDGKRLPGVPAHYLRLDVSVAPAPGLWLAVEHRMSSAVYADDDNLLKARGWGAGVTSLRASWRTSAGHLLLAPYAGVDNLFDRAYVSSVVVNGFGGRVFEPAPGRTMYLGIEAGL